MSEKKQVNAEQMQLDAERVLEQLTSRQQPGDLAKLDRQFESKLQRLECDEDAPAEMLDQLRVLWRMLAADDATVPWRAKALIMGAISYFVSPIDLIPDAIGKPGYFDDAMVVRLVYQRLSAEIKAFIDSPS